ncbi:DUF1016 N-terminal domain-containing protein [Arsenicicoccus dermatophilus]|uniref:DUF1016 N-terminal domain-containing protein n=1 Tax=Arsenicicoccus dermatophilus TaxID=1076331 RepID=UPI001F4C85C2|nr:DUF1016 N-terminal domain-containing protein [Arsenicicoccus dermatophilus]
MLGEVVARLAAGQARAVTAVGVERIRTYHAVGSVIAAAQREQGWGAQVIDRLSADLRARFPDQAGLSPRNLRYMRDLAVAWPDGNVATAATTFPWGHVTVLLSQVKDPTVRVWYVEQAVAGRVDGHPHGALDRGGLGCSGLAGMGVGAELDDEADGAGAGRDQGGRVDAAALHARLTPLCTGVVHVLWAGVSGSCGNGRIHTASIRHEGRDKPFRRTD